MSHTSPPFLSIEQLAERWGIPTNTLAAWRCEGKGPRYVRLAPRLIRYPMDAVLEHESAGTVVPLSLHEAYSR